MDYASPQRMSLVNTASGEQLEVQFNPEELREKVVVNYSFLKVPGLPHSPAQYSGTENHAVGFEVHCVGDSRATRAQIDEFRRFLLSLCYPMAGADTISAGAPPRVLFVWPGIFTMTAIVKSVEIGHKHFTAAGVSRFYSATVELEEARDFRLTSEQVRASGTRRPPDTGTSSA